jgi:2-C-methyl-D-erythritol 2,4-cyclodiphosphate synthase
MELRIGNGYDIHRLVAGRPLILGGISIPFTHGLLGHSDADCLCHAITDALLGALALPNIGQFYPDTDPANGGMLSTEILRNIFENYIHSRGYRIVNIDGVIIAEEPKLAPQIQSMRQNLCRIMHISPQQIGLKATTQEGLDSVGQRLAIACYAVCLLEKTPLGSLKQKFNGALSRRQGPCGTE